VKRYEDVINRIADAIGVPRAVAQALADTEDNLRDASAVRDAGESYGLLSVQLPTAREYGYSGSSEGLKDPATNVLYGLRYLKAMYQRFGDWSRAYAAYNAGPDLSPWPAGNVSRFQSNLARWGKAYGGFLQPPILTAGIGGWLLAVAVLGWLLPQLIRRRRRGRSRR